VTILASVALPATPPVRASLSPGATGQAAVIAPVIAPVSAVRPAAASYRLEGTYDVWLHLDWDTRRLRVRTTITLRNTTGSPVDRLDLNTVAAKLGSMRGLRVSVDGDAVKPRVVGQTIKVVLSAPLAVDATSHVRVAYGARLRTTVGGRSFFFARLGDVAQLYRFIPWLSRTIPFGSQDHGEPFLTPTSPRVEVTATSDRPLVWATSGRRVSHPDRLTSTFLARDVRDFVIAASPSWRTVSGRSQDGDTSIVAHTRRLDGRRLVGLARRELARYEQVTGVPYPYPVYRIAESGGGLPMEAPALTWIPGHRTPAELPFLVSHETAHQWWYSIVGNDQSTDAFADEAMADFYARRAHLSIRPSRCRIDRLDRDIRGYSSACYFEVIYVQGARFLQDLRQDFGAARFRRAVRAYTTSERFDIGSNRALLEAFRAEMGEGVVKRFHRRFPSLY
jgi:hypothetical protein